MAWQTLANRMTFWSFGMLVSGLALSQQPAPPVLPNQAPAGAVAPAPADTPFSDQQLPPLPSRPIGLVANVPSILSLSAASLRQLNSGAQSVRVADLNDLQARLKADARGTVSLVEAIRLMTARSFPIEAAKARTDSSHADVRAAYGGFLPNISVRAGSGYETSMPASVLDPITGAALDSDTHIRRELAATVTQPLIDLSALSNIRRTHAARDAAHAVLSGTEDGEALAVVSAYLDLIRASLVLNLTRDHMARLNKLLDYITTRVAGGGSSAADGERVRARVLSSQATAEQARGALDRSLIGFSRLTGVVPAEVPLQSLAGVDLPASLQTAFEGFDANNPNVIEARARQLAAKREYQGVASRFAPNIGIEVSKTKTANAGGKLGWQTDKRALLVVSIPLNPWGTYQLAAAGRDRERAFAFELYETQRQGRETLSVAYNGLETAAAQVAAIRAQVTASEKVVAAYDAQMSATNRSLLDVIDAYEQFYQANVNLVQSSVAAANLYYSTLQTLGQLRPTLATATTE